MIFSHFLRWVEEAPATKRRHAAAALARAWLKSDLTGDERIAAEAALVRLAEDPSPKVREALADALSLSVNAPAQIIAMLAGDQIEVAAIVLARSPLLSDAELVDRVALGGDAVQQLIASRPRLSAQVSAALAEVGGLSACLILLNNGGASIASVSFRRLAERLGHEPQLRGALLRDPRLPAQCRHLLLRKLGEALQAMDIVAACVGSGRAAAVTEDACLQATLDLADELSADELPALVEHLRLCGALTTALVIRAAAFGKIDLFAAILVGLSGRRTGQVRAVLVNGRASLVASLLRAAGLADATHPPLIAALQAWRDVAVGRISAGPRQVSLAMLEAAAPASAIMSHANDDLAALLQAIHLDAMREDARERALEIAAA